MRRFSVVTTCIFLCAGCAFHYSGRVVDTHGRPVANARVKGIGLSDVILNGTMPVDRSVVTDAEGIFTLTSAESLSDFEATSSDSKRRGWLTVRTSKQPFVIIVK
jgi:hypothetical protein